MSPNKKPTIDILLAKIGNKFKLSNVVALRAKQISEGSLPYVDNFDPDTPILTALKEIATDRIKIKIVEKKEKAAKAEEKKKKPRLTLADLAREDKKKYKRKKKK